MNYDVQAYPSNVPPDELQACLSIIRQGCAVDPESATRELPWAAVVVIVRAGKAIAGVGAIKRRRPQYATRKSTESGFQFNPDTLELGYVAVENAHRGNKLSRQIVAGLLSAFQGDSLFATTSSDRMRRTLEKAGFVRRGSEWDGEKGKLSLWIWDRPDSRGPTNDNCRADQPTGSRAKTGSPATIRDGASQGWIWSHSHLRTAETELRPAPTIRWIT